MGLIQVTPELLRQRAAELRADRQEHDELMNKMMSLVNSLPDEWKGDAATAFINSYNNQKTVFDNFSQLLENFAVELEYDADNFEEIQKRIVEHINRQA